MQRFLWQGPDDKEMQVLELQVMSFGATCSPTLAQFVKNFNADRFEDIYPEAAHAIKYMHYVDDYLDSRDSKEELINLAMQVKQIHQGEDSTFTSGIRIPSQSLVPWAAK